MELILINNQKLKIMLSKDDMRDYDISCDSVDYSNTETRRAFWSILDEAKHRTGFDAASARIYIQLYPSKSGGCELYVTKLSSSPTESCPVRPPQGRELAFGFEGIGPLLRVCRRLALIGFSGGASAFRDEMNRACLFLSGVDDTFLDRLSFIGEFGEELDPSDLHAYIDEHGSCICSDNAVELLAELA